MGLILPKNKAILSLCQGIGAFKMSDNLHFKPSWYRITKIIEPNVIEVDGTWFIKLKGVADDNSPEEIKKWLKTDYVVRVIPYRRDSMARIISEVWLGNTYINRQFSNYKIDNFIQAFEEWEKNQNSDYLEFKEKLKDLIKAFDLAKPEIKNKTLKTNFEKWLGNSNQKAEKPIGTDESLVEREKLLKEITTNFNQWKNKIKPKVTA